MAASKRATGDTRRHREAGRSEPGTQLAGDRALLQENVCHSRSGEALQRTGRGGPGRNRGLQTDGQEFGGLAEIVKRTSPPKWGHLRAEGAQSRSEREGSLLMWLEADFRVTHNVLKTIPSDALSGCWMSACLFWAILACDRDTLGLKLPLWEGGGQC